MNVYGRVCTHVQAYCSPLFCCWVYDSRSEPYCSSMAIKPCYFVTLESALRSSSGDCLAGLLSARDDVEQPLMGWGDIAHKLSLYPPLSPPPPPSLAFSGRKLYPLFFQKHKIVILCLRFLNLGEDANGSRGKAVGREN